MTCTAASTRGSAADGVSGNVQLAHLTLDLAELSDMSARLDNSLSVGRESDFVIVAPPQPSKPAITLSEDQLLLFELRVDQLSVTDSLAVYDSGGMLLVPLGELARMLDIDMTVSPGERRVVGTIGEARRSLVIDFATNTARLAGKPLPFDARDVVFTSTDAYVRAELLSAILAVQVGIKGSELLLDLTTTGEKLPIQQRLDRLARLRDLSPDVDGADTSLRISTPYRGLTAPSFDVNLETGASTRTPKFPRRYDIRAAGDVLWTNFQGFMGSDSNGSPSSARLLFERIDPEGGILGPLDATRATAGDTYAPALPIGARSVGGRGFSVTSSAVEQTSVFDRIDLRGELPIGFDVELYVNDVLRGGQETPVQGRYEFRDVPLVRGINVIRIVSYGPRGERSESTRIISVGGGALPKGDFTFDAGVIQQDRQLVTLDRNINVPTPGSGDVRAVLGVAYGLTETVTVTAGAASYTATSGDQRQLGTLGIRTSLFGNSLTVDAAHDDRGGSGVVTGIAGQPFGVGVIARHAEYTGGFVDEALPFGGDGRPLKRYTEINTDFTLRKQDGIIPLSVRGQRQEYVDGTETWIGGFRSSSTIGKIAASGTLDYERTSSPGAVTNETLVGSVDASTFAAFQWQLRGSLDFELLPSARLRAMAVTADRDIADKMALRLGFGHSFQDDKKSTVQAGTTFRLGFADLSLMGDYTTPGNDWSIGLTMSFSIVQDPLRGRYVLTRPGAASGGNLALRAFVDRDSDDRFSDGDEPVPGLSITGGVSPVVTDEEGRALVTGLGAGRTTRLQLSLDGIDNPFVSSPPLDLAVVPRPGRTASLPFPLKPTGEVLARITFKRPEGPVVGLSAVQVMVKRQGADGILARTEFDGSVLFERLPAGDYVLTIDPQQAERLGMVLTKPMTFTIPTDGGFVPDVTGEVVFTSATRK